MEYNSITSGNSISRTGQLRLRELRKHLTDILMMTEEVLESAAEKNENEEAFEKMQTDMLRIMRNSQICMIMLELQANYVTDKAEAGAETLTAGLQEAAVKIREALEMMQKEIAGRKELLCSVAVQQADWPDKRRQADAGLTCCEVILEDMKSYAGGLCKQSMELMRTGMSMDIVQWNSFKEVLVDYIAATHAVQKKIRNRVFQFRKRRLSDANYSIQYAEGIPLS